jgi:4-hydroxybenzoate polyprenyltransferase
MAIFRLIRLQNLLMIFITQILTYQCLVLSNFLPLSTDSSLYLLIFGTLLIAAGGYAINDYFDINTDKINKPNQMVVEKIIPKKDVKIIWLSFTIIALTIGFYIKLEIFVIYLISAILLYLYSRFLKEIPIVGNISVSILLALSVMIIYIYEPGFDKNLFIFYSAFAFLSGMVREIVKDVEDLEGDSQTNVLTFPVKKGIRKTRNLIIGFYATLDLLMVGFAVYLYFFYNTKMMWYYIVLVYFPHLIIFLKFLFDYDIQQYTRISKRTKLLITLGILSMLMFNQKLM